MIDVTGDICLASKWEFASIAAPRQEKGVARQKFRKELIKIGDYVKHADGIQFSVTRGNLKHWADTFHAMKTNGVKVGIPSSHETVDDSDGNRGWVEDIYVDGDTLVMACDLIGDDAIKAAARNDVSIGCPVELIDGHGNKYERPIHHVALTPNPVIPGLGAFERIAASHKKDNPMEWTKFEKRLGIDAGTLTDANAEEKIGELFTGRDTLVLSNVTKALGCDTIESADKIDGAVKVVVDGKVAKGIELASKSTSNPPSAHIVKLTTENGELKLSNLVKAGRITPKAKDDLKELFLSEKALTLSLSNNGTTDTFDCVLKILETNEPVPLEGKTGPQTILKLADVYDAKENPLLADTQRRVDEAKAQKAM